MATTVYARWDLAFPAIPPRSQFHALKPLGVGTCQVESLIDYFVRLSASHQLSMNDLLSLDQRSSDSETEPKAKSRRTADLSYSVNGVGPEAKHFVTFLRKLTLRNDLEQLTLLAFRDVVPSARLFRRFRAWCPICLELWKEAGVIVYDPLCWSIACVESCSIHSVPLVDFCPNCNRRQHPLYARTKPGFCSLCGRWLGSALQKKSVACISNYQQYIAEAVGKMLILGAKLESVSIRQCIRTTMTDYAEREFEGNTLALAGAVQCNRLTYKSWCEGHAVAPLDELLRISYELHLPLDVLLGEKTSELPVPTAENGVTLTHSRSVGPKRPKDRIRKLLEESLCSNDPRSISDLARTLGYASTGPLYAADPELCYQITNRYRASGRGYRRKKNGAGKLCDRTQVEQKLKDNLSQYPPRPVSQIVAECGYANSAYILGQFTELSRATTVKRAAHIAETVERIRSALEAAAIVIPPPMLSQVATQCGLKGASQLRRYAPDLCDKVLLARESFLVNYRARLQAQVETLTLQDPPLSVREVANRTNVKQRIIRNSFPDLCRKIGAKYREHLQKVSLARQEAMYQAVRKIVQELLLKGERPTQDRVLKYANDEIPHSWNVLYAAVKKARQELFGSLDVSPSTRSAQDKMPRERQDIKINKAKRAAASK